MFRPIERSLSMARLISLGILLLVIVFLGITFYQVVAPFLLPLFLAGVVTILCQPVYGYFLRRMGRGPRLAAGMTTTVVLVLVLVPLLLGVLFATLELYAVAQEAIGSPDWERSFRTVTQWLVDWRLIEQLPAVAIDSSTQQPDFQQHLGEALRSLADRSSGAAGRTLGRTIGSIIGMVIGSAMFGIALYYFLADGPSLLAGAQRLLPLDRCYQQELLREFETVVRSSVSATLVASTVQGLLTAIALLVTGVSIESELLCRFFLVFVVSTFASLVPITGAWLVWVPVAIWLWTNGFVFGAVLLTLFGLGVIGTIDNVIRIYILQSDTRLHPLLAFVSVLGGVHVMGLWGVFIGPIVACCLHALVRMFNIELGKFSIDQLHSADDPDTVSVDPVDVVGPEPTEAGAPTGDSAGPDEVDPDSSEVTSD
ncbi:MAG: hypothetical protein CMJ65_18515 [Planctomycetaceae bacterium]|jgi:predicted PurR-regulated permease PerM|nr:hypothetical protein [Planctomycetaceae bacterium]